MPTDSRRLAQAVARLNRRLRQERKSELSAGQLSLMGSVLLLQPATPSELAAAEMVSGPAMTRTLKCLIEDGHLSRRPHPDDGRQVLIEISEQGQAALVDERQRRDSWLDERLATLTVEERAVVRAAAPLLRKLAEDDA